jgi:hypothetical protein
MVIVEMLPTLESVCICVCLHVFMCAYQSVCQHDKTTLTDTP